MRGDRGDIDTCVVTHVRGHAKVGEPLIEEGRKRPRLMLVDEDRAPRGPSAPCFAELLAEQLERLIPAGVDVRGNATRARIVLFRKPIERRAKDVTELADLLHEVLVAQVATFLGVEPSVIDPEMGDE